MIRIQVPATTANMGAGFDCFGMALQRYNLVELEVASAGLYIDVGGTMRVPTDERNLLYQVIRTTLTELGKPVPGLRIRQKNNIPTTRGLGSSAACCVAGILAANFIAGNPWNRQQIFARAAKWETHPDNVAPALFGNFTIAYQQNGQVGHMSIPVAERLKCALLIPNFTLPTRKARALVPGRFPRQDAVFNISRASMFAVAMATGRYEYLNVGAKDRLHEQYRSSLVPHFREITEKAYELGARAAFLSGAGPTIVALLDSGYDAFQQNMDAYLRARMPGWEVSITDVCREGAKLEIVR